MPRQQKVIYLQIMEQLFSNPDGSVSVLLPQYNLPKYRKLRAGLLRALRSYSKLLGMTKPNKTISCLLIRPESSNDCIVEISLITPRPPLIMFDDPVKPEQDSM